MTKSAVIAIIICLKHFDNLENLLLVKKQIKNHVKLFYLLNVWSNLQIIRFKNYIVEVNTV